MLAGKAERGWLKLKIQKLPFGKFKSAMNFDFFLKFCMFKPHNPTDINV